MNKLLCFLIFTFFTLSFTFSNQIVKKIDMNDSLSSVKFLSGNICSFDDRSDIKFMKKDKDKKKGDDGAKGKAFFVKHKTLWFWLAVGFSIGAGVFLTLDIIGWGLHYGGGFYNAGYLWYVSTAFFGPCVLALIVFWVFYGLAIYFSKNAMLKDKIFISDKDISFGIRL